MKTKNGHDVGFDHMRGYGRVFGCARCLTSLMTHPIDSDRQVIEQFDAYPCKPTPLTLDQERGQHECLESEGQKTYYDGSFGGPVEIARDPEGKWF